MYFICTLNPCLFCMVLSCPPLLMLSTASLFTRAFCCRCKHGFLNGFENPFLQNIVEVIQNSTNSIWNIHWLKHLDTPFSPYPRIPFSRTWIAYQTALLKSFQKQLSNHFIGILSRVLCCAMVAYSRTRLEARPWRFFARKAVTTLGIFASSSCTIQFWFLFWVADGLGRRPKALQRAKGGQETTRE